MYDLGRQIRQRFLMWKDELKNHLYTPVGTVHFQFCTTLGHPTPDEAEKMPLSPCPAGTKWGGMWEYGWFFADVTLPETCEGRRVALFSCVGDGLLSIAAAAAKANMREDEFRARMERDRRKER